ncbi:hypothetical protein HNO88_000564 [Novosphingobium chloroacetimidivorans]|uniref:Uncharacterized protein n=1 Tax=Novosphingobium chloroacetimidivorans TaxID=1428314 RepID=A0A7W7NVL8_9SPHN|nr:hypothetical protein [Novosphingobium chloroacetimidivorans]MBB4857257.1 hypothetical protein [Novosphingobium chloroacetimidivorans]
MAIYGECIGVLERTPVTISALDGLECQLEARTGANRIEGLLDLWIGAIGPLPVTAEHSGGRVRAKFREPLDERIIAHFAHA